MFLFFCISNFSIHVGFFWGGCSKEARKEGRKKRTETSSSFDSVFVDDAERSPALVSLVVVRGKGESVVCVEPAVVGVTALRPGSLCDFQGGRSCG